MELGSNNTAVVVAVYAALMYDVISATNSSPQTTEINASVRGETLMKWVYIGLAQGGFYALLGAYLEPKHRWAPLMGGGIAGVLMYLQYRHALVSGMENAHEPGTEIPGGIG